MTQEEKQLLLKDLCARLPYGVKAKTENTLFDITGIEGNIIIHKPWYIWGGEYTTCGIEFVKPYLRPMSSMTEEEEIELCTISYAPDEMKTIEEKLYVIKTNAENAADFYNKHHLDYRGLISMGLALEAPEGMYKND